jgi:drug/metabolite transporter (DMT)-like permease
VHPLVGAALAVVFWGVSFVATAAAVREISPLALVFARTALGAVTLVVILRVRRERILPPRAALPSLAAMGFVGVALLYAEPLVTLAAAVALLGEPVGLVTVAGGALVIGGVAIVQRA